MARSIFCLLLLFSSLSLLAQPPATLNWAFHTGGTFFEEVTSMDTDNQGNVYLTGFFSDTVDFDPGAGNFQLSAEGSSNAFVAKYDSSGALIWSLAIICSGITESRSIAVDSSGFLTIAGRFSGQADFDPDTTNFIIGAPGFGDIFVARYDTAGVLMNAVGIGGSYIDFANSITCAPDGGVYLTGQFGTTVDFDPGPGISNISSNGSADIFLCKLDSSLNFEWAYGFGGSAFDSGSSVTSDSSGRAIVTGSYSGMVDFEPGPGSNVLTSVNGTADVFLICFNSAGTLQWASSIGGPTEDTGIALASGHDDHIFITGAFRDSVDFDPGSGVQQLVSNGGFDIFVASYDQSGNHRWSRNVGGATTDAGYGICVDTLKNVYVTGSFEGTGDFDPGAGVSTLTSSGLADSFILKLDSLGNYKWSAATGGPTGNQGVAVFANAEYIYHTGYYSSSMNFQIGSGAPFVLPSNGGTDFFLAKYDLVNSGITDEIQGGHIKVFPNPSNGIMNILLDEFGEDRQIAITDIAGKIVKQYPVNPRENFLQIDATDLSNGFYLLKVSSKNYSQVLKIVIEK